MEAHTRRKVLQIASRHSRIGPARIAEHLGLFVGDVAELFDSSRFQDEKKAEEMKLIVWALDNVYRLNVPVQQIKSQMADAAHSERINLARDLIYMLPTNSRWPL